MLTITMKATEMKDAKVAHISLVDRAATRIPFKVIKQEKSMSVLKHLDLASVFKKEKPAALPAEIVGVITMKAEGFESVKTQISAAGFSVEKQGDMEDKSVIFGQSEDMTGEHVLVRLSENAVIAVKRFSPYNMDMAMGDGSSFADLCQAQGFYPGVGTMVDVLRSSVLQLAEKSDDGAAAAVQVGKMFDEAKQYAMTMVRGLPSKAFKLESIVPEEVAPVVKTEAELAAEAEEVAKASMSDDEKAHMGKLKGADKMAFAQMSSEDRAKHMAAPAKKEDSSEAPATEGEKAPATETAVAPVTEAVVADLVSKGLTEFTAKMEAMLGGVSKAVESVGTSVQALTSRVEAAEGVAKAASEAVAGTVVLGSEGDDPVVAQKSESRSFGREIDTAYLPRSQRNTTGRR